MPKPVSINIGNMDFSFKHSLVKIIANRNCPEIKLVGLNIGPFEEGNEYEIPFWIAQELEKAGIARFREEERLDTAKLYKMQWTERVQTVGQISKLSENFYPKLRRYLEDLKEEASKTPEKLREYEKSRHVAQDLVNSRLKKIVSLASAPPQAEQTLKNFTNEERFLYEQLNKLVLEWKTRILECKEIGE
jgi:hypothetical protein